MGIFNFCLEPSQSLALIESFHTTLQPLQPDSIRSGSIHKNNECIIPFCDPPCFNIPLFTPAQKKTPSISPSHTVLPHILTFISICCWLQINKREDRWKTQNFASSVGSQWDLIGRKLHCGNLGGEKFKERKKSSCCLHLQWTQSKQMLRSMIRNDWKVYHPGGNKLQLDQRVCLKPEDLFKNIDLHYFGSLLPILNPPWISFYE